MWEQHIKLPSLTADRAHSVLLKLTDNGHLTGHLPIYSVCLQNLFIHQSIISLHPSVNSIYSSINSSIHSIYPSIHSIIYLQLGSPNLILEGLCPAEFSSNLPQHTSLEVSSIPSKALISCFRCVLLGLELNFASHLLSRTVSGDPWSTVTIHPSIHPPTVSTHPPIYLYWYIHLQYLQYISIHSIIHLQQGCPNLVQEGRCPAEFSSNLPQPAGKILVCLIRAWLAGSGLFNWCWRTKALQDQIWAPLIYTIYSSTHLSIHQSINPSAASIHPSIVSIQLSICQHYLSIHQSINPSIHASIHPSIQSPISLQYVLIHPSIYSIHPSIVSSIHSYTVPIHTPSILKIKVLHDGINNLFV